MTGRVHIYTGDGKGKTTAAVGLAVRAAGAGMRVLLVQFLKGRETAELAPLRQLGVEIVRSDDVTKFIPDMTPAEREICRAAQQRCLAAARDGMETHDMLILDEAFGAAATGMIDAGRLETLVRGKPSRLELVLTGRDAPPELIALADYVSEIRCVRHPYDKGVKARRGIEF